MLHTEEWSQEPEERRDAWEVGVNHSAHLIGELGSLV